MSAATSLGADSFEVSLPPQSEWGVVGVKAKDASQLLGPCRLFNPNGQLIQEKGGTTGQEKLSSDQDMTEDGDEIRFFVERPQGGVWRLECDGSTEGVLILVNWAPVPPRIIFLSPEWDIGGRAVDIVVQVDDPDSTPDVVLYRDDDDKGFDGEALTQAMRPVEGRVAWRWDLTKAPQGVHHLYAVAYDGENAVVQTYASGRVFVQTAADVAVTADFLKGAADETVLRLRVDNLGPDAAQDVVVTWEWPAGALQPVTQMDDWGVQDVDKAQVVWSDLPTGTHQEVLWPFDPVSAGPWAFVITAKGSPWDPIPLNNAVVLEYDRNAFVFNQLDVSRGYVPDRVPSGALLEYTVRIRNPSDDPVEDLIVHERIPDEAILVETKASLGVIQRENEGIFLRINKLLPKEEAVLSVALSLVGKGDMFLETTLSQKDREKNMVYLKKRIEIMPR